MVQCLEHARGEPLSQSRMTLPFRTPEALADLTSLTQADDARHVEGARAQSPLVAAAIEHEAQGYAHLLPDGTQWKATLLIELPDAEQRARSLGRLSEAVHHLYVQCDRPYVRVAVEANEDLPDRHLGRPSAVHFLRFQLPDGLRRAVHQGAPVFIGCAHHQYQWRRLVPRATLQMLAADLSRNEVTTP